MSVFDFLFKKNKQSKKPKEPESPELKKTLSNPQEHKNSEQQVVIMENMAMEEPKVYSPAVEHPLLTIQDHISKLEEIYKSLNDKMVVIDGKMATKDDINDLKTLLHEDLLKGDNIITGINGLGERLDTLRKVRNELTRQVDITKNELTQQEEALEKVDTEIELLECDEKLIAALRENDMSTIELAEKVGLTRQYIWGRLKELQSAGYVSSVKSGRKTKYKLVKFT